MMLLRAAERWHIILAPNYYAKPTNQLNQLETIATLLDISGRMDIRWVLHGYQLRSCVSRA